MDENRQKGLGLTLLIKQLSNELIFAILTCVTSKTAGQLKDKFSPHDFTATSSTEIDFFKLNEELGKQLVLKDGAEESEEDQNVLTKSEIHRRSSEQVKKSQALDRQESAPNINVALDDMRSELSINCHAPVCKVEREQYIAKRIHEFKMLETKINCIEWAPDAFKQLRELDNIDDDYLFESLNPQSVENIEKIKKAGEGMGKSGSFFFFSHDKKLLIKTMKDDDFEAF